MLIFFLNIEFNSYREKNEHLKIIMVSLLKDSKNNENVKNITNKGENCKTSEYFCYCIIGRKVSFKPIFPIGGLKVFNPPIGKALYYVYTRSLKQLSLQRTKNFYTGAYKKVPDHHYFTAEIRPILQNTFDVVIKVPYPQTLYIVSHETANTPFRYTFQAKINKL